MQKRPWIFHAMTFLLLANLLLSKQLVIGILLLCLWLLRILLLKDKEIIWQTVILSCFFIGIILIHQQRNATNLEGDEQVFILTTEISSVKVDGDHLSFAGTIHQTEKTDLQEKIVVRYYLKTEEEKEKWLQSSNLSKIKIKGKLNQPAQNINFNQFNYQTYLKRKNIHWQLYAEEIDSLEDLNLHQSFFYRVDALRYRIIQYMDRLFHEKISSYLKILFIADGSALTEETKESYRTLGLIHLFSISGFHIGYLAQFIQKIFLRMGITHERTNLLVVIILPLYGLVAGLSISVFRAVCQRTLQLWSAILDRELSSIDAWALTLIGTLAVNPYHLFEVAFQLSYSLSGLFIILGQLQWIRESSFFKQSLLFSFLSFLVSIPILSYHFYEISWVTMLTNFLFIPFFTYVLFPGLAILFLMSFVISNTVIFLFLNQLFALFLINLELFLFDLTEGADFTFVIGRLPQVVIAILVVCILHLLKKAEHQKPPSILVTLLLILSIGWYRISPVGYVIMLDVGQGDSILVKEPGTRKVTLIDTGGEIQWQEKEKWQKREETFTIGQDIVVPALKSMGIAKIDRLYITHAHEDHMGEVERIYQKIPIKEIAATGRTLHDQALKKKLIQLKESRLIEVCPALELTYPTTRTVALQPLKNYESKNDQSLVLYVNMGGDVWLFTGDMEAAAERDLIQAYPNLKVDYLKVGHHGSNTSSTKEFIDHIQPTTALISAGKKNRYGHPNAEVLELFKERQIITYLTAENGAIKVSYFKLPLVNKWISKVETIK